MNNFNFDIEKQLSRLGKDIQDLVERVVPDNIDKGDFHPACDVTESNKYFSVFVDVPGMDKDQIQITLKDSVITISGERELFLDEGEELKRSERKQGLFSRSFALPEYIKKDSIKAVFSDGVLTIKMEKTGMESEEKGTTIPIE